MLTPGVKTGKRGGAGGSVLNRLRSPIPSSTHHGAILGLRSGQAPTQRKLFPRLIAGLQSIHKDKIMKSLFSVTPCLRGEVLICEQPGTRGRPGSNLA